MERYLGKFSEYAYAILRIITGLMFAMHGAQKLLGWPAHKTPVLLASKLGAAGVIELVCGVLIAIGLLAGYAAFIACGEMAFAYFTVHAPGGPFPILNGGELAVLNCFIFLLIATRGPGVLSVDAIRGKGKGRRR